MNISFPIKLEQYLMVGSYHKVRDIDSTSNRGVDDDDDDDDDGSSCLYIYRLLVRCWSQGHICHMQLILSSCHS